MSSALLQFAGRPLLKRTFRPASILVGPAQKSSSSWKAARERHEQQVQQTRRQAPEAVLEDPSRNVSTASRHAVANTIQSLLANDESFFLESMNVLELNPGFSGKNSEDNTNLLIDQYRRLFYDSIPSFRKQVLSNPPPDLQASMDKMVEGGCASPDFTRGMRSFMQHQGREEVLLDRIRNAQDMVNTSKGRRLARAKNRLQKAHNDLEQFKHNKNWRNFQKAQGVIDETRTEICRHIAKHIRKQHAALVEQYRALDEKTDLTKPQEWYPYARLDRRKIIFHGGPTNSGKTYMALERLANAKNGMYLAPLRLLAAEVYETLTMKGIHTNLYTGQEKREVAFSTHFSATVEMANLQEEFEVVVLDEIQMLGDASRGAAWTRALLGVRSKEIHVCGGLEAQTLVEKIALSCGDDLEVKMYSRFSELKVSDKSLAKHPKQVGSYKSVRPGDCVVAFSRDDIFAIKREIEQSTPYKCCVVYGTLPPQIRTDQARLFNDPQSGYDVLVASDAIGMGLNLNIRRIIFNSVFKFNGESVIRLDHSAVKQIAGRAGRRNSIYPNGEVTCRDSRDLEYIRDCLSKDVAQIPKAGLLPTANHIELFGYSLHTHPAEGEKPSLHSILQQFSALATVKGDFFLCKQTEMQMIAKRLEGIEVSLRNSYILCLSPTTENSLSVLASFARKMSLGQVSGLPHRRVPKKARTFQDLAFLCGLYGEADLFLWLQMKFPPENAVEQQAALSRKELVLGHINDALTNADTLSLKHCYIERAESQRAEWLSMEGIVDDALLDVGEAGDDFRDADGDQSVGFVSS